MRNYDPSDYYDPDYLYNKGEYTNQIAFIYDNGADRLLYNFGSGDDATHRNIIIQNFDYFSRLIDQILYKKYHDKPHEPQNTIELSKLPVTARLGNANANFFRITQSIRLRLEEDYQEKFVFGRSGFHAPTETILYSFWRDYDNQQVHNAINYINQIEPEYKNYKKFISRPSGTTEIHQQFTRRADAEDLANEKRLLHLMAANDKKKELLNIGAKPKGLNPWRQEAMKFGLAEPWRMTSESITAFTKAYQQLINDL